MRPDIVFSGHVHNYQRFTKEYKDGLKIPFIVAGAGGYDELHPVALKSDKRFTNKNDLFEGVNLENYCGDKHGFLKISIEKSNTGLTLKGQYYTIPHEEKMDNTMQASLADEFELHL